MNYSSKRLSLNFKKEEEKNNKNKKKKQLKKPVILRTSLKQTSETIL